MRVPGFCGLVRVVGRLSLDGHYRVRSVVYRRGHGWQEVSADVWAWAGGWRPHDGYSFPGRGGAFRPDVGDVCLCVCGEDAEYILLPPGNDVLFTPDGPISFKAADQPITAVRSQE